MIFDIREPVVILSLMIGVAMVESLLPFRGPAGADRGRRRVNLALTTLTFATNIALSAVIVAGLSALETNGVGLTTILGAPPLAAFLIALAGFDLTFYATHVALHKQPTLWRFHQAHHSDPAVDVTTAFRQHPIEGAFRYGAIGAVAGLLGASPAAFAFYRLLSAITAILEHANVRTPLPVARILALVTTWPLVHKVHHSRVVAETDSNYGNLLSIWDRLFGTYTPPDRALVVRYGLDGEELAGFAHLLVTPFLRSAPEGDGSSPACAENANAR